MSFFFSFDLAEQGNYCFYLDIFLNRLFCYCWMMRSIPTINYSFALVCIEISQIAIDDNCIEVVEAEMYYHPVSINISQTVFPQFSFLLCSVEASIHFCLFIGCHLYSLPFSLRVACAYYLHKLVLHYEFDGVHCCGFWLGVYLASKFPKEWFFPGGLHRVLIEYPCLQFIVYVCYSSFSSWDVATVLMSCFFWIYAGFWQIVSLLHVLRSEKPDI